MRWRVFLPDFFLRRRHFGAGLLCLCCVGPASAEDSNWQTVMRDAQRQVQLNHGTILSTDDGGRVAWARVLLSSAEAADRGYISVRVLNRYDCKARTYLTVKREYVDVQRNVVREESPAGQKPRSFERHSVDERLWREVCGGPSITRLRDAVRRADSAAGALQR